MTGREFAQLLQRYGQSLQRQGEDMSFQAFLQPVRHKNGGLLLQATPLGAADERTWLCLSGAEDVLQRGMLLLCKNRQFRVQHAAPVYIGEELLYHRAVLRCCGEVAQ